MVKQLGILCTTLLLITFQSSVGMAAGNPDQGPGCGLGKLAWQDYKNQKQIVPQVLMATTNGTFGSTTFGISFGTSGCTNDGVIMGEMRAHAFTEATVANLSQDIARGGGEHLASLATLLGISPDEQSAFFERAQKRYAYLMETGETSTAALIAALHDASGTEPVLAKLSATR